MPAAGWFRPARIGRGGGAGGAPAAGGAAARSAAVRAAVESKAQERRTRCMVPPGEDVRNFLPPWYGPSPDEAIRVCANLSWTIGERIGLSRLPRACRAIRRREHLPSERDRGRESIGDAQLAIGVLEVLADRARGHVHASRDSPLECPAATSIRVRRSCGVRDVGRVGVEASRTSRCTAGAIMVRTATSRDENSPVRRSHHNCTTWSLPLRNPSAKESDSPSTRMRSAWPGTFLQCTTPIRSGPSQPESLSVALWPLGSSTSSTTCPVGSVSAAPMASHRTSAASRSSTPQGGSG